MVSTVAAPTGIARSLQQTLEVESVRLEVPERREGRILLLNPRRLEILLTAAAYPGVHLRSASRLLLAPLPSLRFHVQKLASDGLLHVRRTPGRAALFLPSTWPPRFEPFLSAWQDPFDRRILRLVRGNPGIPLSTLRRQVLPDARPLGASLTRLISCGAIRRQGPADPRLAPTPRWRRFEAACREETPRRLERFLGLLREEGLRPMLEEASAERARISVDGPRSRIRFVLPLNPLQRDD